MYAALLVEPFPFMGWTGHTPVLQDVKTCGDWEVQGALAPVTVSLILSYDRARSLP